MERTQLFDLMGELKLYGMKAAFDEIMATAVKRQHEPQRIVGDLLNAEINEKQARSIKYQLTIAKLPLAKDLEDFQFEGTPINQTLVNDLASGGFIAQQRNAVLVGGTGTAKHIWPSRAPEAASDLVPAAASTTSSTSSTAWRSRPATDGNVVSPSI
jgi:DNA replication protein DnaC